MNLTQAALIANASITADVTNPVDIRKQSNDWQLSTETYQGNFGSNYAGRASVAIAGYQQLPAQQVLYPGWRSTGFTSRFSLAVAAVDVQRQAIGAGPGIWLLVCDGVW